MHLTVFNLKKLNFVEYSPGIACETKVLFWPKPTRQLRRESRDSGAKRTFNSEKIDFFNVLESIPLNTFTTERSINKGTLRFISLSSKIKRSAVNGRLRNCNGFMSTNILSEFSSFTSESLILN